MTDTAESPNDVRPPRPRSFRRRVATWAALFTAMYVAWCGVLYVMQDKLVFPSDMAPDASPRFLWPLGESVRIARPIEGGAEVEARLILAEGASVETPAPLVVLLHGNAEIIDQRLDVAEAYWRMGCSVLLPEYRGYGRSGGVPTQDGIVGDVVWFYDQVITRPDVDATRVVQHGISLGGGVAAQLAGQRQPTALILESTFTSVAVMAHNHFAPMFLAKYPFRTDHVLPTLECPVLVLHGNRDRIIPVEHGKQLHALARHATYVEFPCGHNDFPGDANVETYYTELEAFLADTGVIQP